MQGGSGKVGRIVLSQMGGSLQLVTGQEGQAFHCAQPWTPHGTKQFSLNFPSVPLDSQP
jgi:hypothetical protein